MYVSLLNCCTSNALHLSNSSTGRRNVYVQIPNCSPLAIFQGYLQPDPGWHQLWICLPYWLGEEGSTKCCQTTKIMKKKIFKNLHWWKTFKKYIYYMYGVCFSRFFIFLDQLPLISNMVFTSWVSWLSFVISAFSWRPKTSGRGLIGRVLM